jgi:predicted RNA-binding protein with PIN domain
MTEIPHKLEDQRLCLIRFVEVKNPQGSQTNKITIVFDGKSDVFSPPVNSFVKVLFSSDETADDKIKRMVASSSNAKNIIVVTNDRAIQYAVKATGAKVLSVENFLKKAEGRKRGSSNVSGKSKKEVFKNIPRSVEQEINQELKDVWLNTKKNKDNS